MKQDAVLSPILFTVYLDPLIERIMECQAGCQVDNVRYNVFGYAEDPLLLVPTNSAMRKILSRCEDYGVEFNLTSNPNKCLLFIFHRPGSSKHNKDDMFLEKNYSS